MAPPSAPDPGFRGFVACACTALAAAALVYHATRRLLRRSDAALFHEVVFFPELPVPTAAASGCERDAPPPSDGRRLDCVLRWLAAVRRSLDVCVFVLTCPDLCGALLAASRRGVRVRVVLDQETSTCTGSQLTALWRARVRQAAAVPDAPQVRRGGRRGAGVRPFQLDPPGCSGQQRGRHYHQQPGVSAAVCRRVQETVGDATLMLVVARGCGSVGTGGLVIPCDCVYVSNLHGSTGVSQISSALIDLAADYRGGTRLNFHDAGLLLAMCPA